MISNNIIESLKNTHDETNASSRLILFDCYKELFKASLDENYYNERKMLCKKYDMCFSCGEQLNGKDKCTNCGRENKIV